MYYHYISGMSKKGKDLFLWSKSHSKVSVTKCNITISSYINGYFYWNKTARNCVLSYF